MTVIIPIPFVAHIISVVPESLESYLSHSIIGRAINKDGVTSDYMSSIQIENRDQPLNMFVSKASSYLTLLTPLIALLILLALVGLYGFYHIKKAHSFIKKKLSPEKNPLVSPWNFVSTLTLSAAATKAVFCK